MSPRSNSNPYAAPRSAITEKLPDRRRTPVLLSIIRALFDLWALVALPILAFAAYELTRGGGIGDEAAFNLIGLSLGPMGRLALSDTALDYLAKHRRDRSATDR